LAPAAEAAGTGDASAPETAPTTPLTAMASTAAPATPTLVPAEGAVPVGSMPSAPSADEPGSKV